MIIATVHNNGDVHYRCTQCEEFRLVEMQKNLPNTWFITNGYTVLWMLRHFMLKHKRQRIEVPKQGGTK